MRLCLGVLAALTGSMTSRAAAEAQHGPTLQVGGAAVACGGHPSCRDDATGDGVVLRVNRTWRGGERQARDQHAK